MRFDSKYIGLARDFDNGVKFLLEVNVSETDTMEGDNYQPLIVFGQSAQGIGISHWSLHIGYDKALFLRGDHPVFKAFDKLFTSDAERMWATERELTAEGMYALRDAVQLAWDEGLLLCNPDDFPFLDFASE